MRQIFFIVLLIIASASNGFGQESFKFSWGGFPSYETVVFAVLKVYAYDKIAGDQTKFKLEKRSTGYFLKISASEKNFGPFLIWPRNASKPNFSSCVLWGPGSEENIDCHFAQLMDEAEDFERNLYFGYTGWEDDVIAELKAHPNPSSTELQSLSIAYSRKADRIMTVRYHNEGNHPFDANWSLDVFAPSDFVEYDSLAQKAIDVVNQMVKKDPYFPIKTGFPAIRRGSLQMTAWLEYQMIGLEDHAKQWLKPDAFPSSLEDFGYNLLISCPKDAILFVNGDADTYPLYWLQNFKKIRQDVSVVNVSFIKDRRYLRWLTSEMRGKMRLDLGVEIPSEQEMEVCYLTDDYAKPESSIFKSIFHHAGENASLEVEYSVLYLVPEPNPLWIAKPDLESSKIEKIRIAGRNPENEYWDLGDFLELGIIVENFGKRPICFSQMVASECYLSLEDYFSGRGLIYLVRPFEQIDNENDPFHDGSFDGHVSADLFLNKFKLDSIRMSKDPIVLNNIFFAVFRETLYRTIVQLRTEQAWAAVDSLLAYHATTFDFDQVKYSVYDFQLVEFALERKKKGLANAMLDMILRNVEFEIERLGKDELSKLERQILYLYLGAMEDIYRQANRKNDARKIKSYWQKYALDLEFDIQDL